MFLLLLILSSIAFAQDDLHLSSIQNLEDKLPAYNNVIMPMDQTIKLQQGENKYQPPVKVVEWDRIINSGTDLGAINGGISIIRLEDNKPLRVNKRLHLRYYKLEDEHGFKYLVNKDGTTTFRIDSKYVSPLKPELAMYVTPLRYTPAPLIMEKRVYDRKLDLRPEASVYLGYVMGDFMKDLYNDPSARTGITNQVGMHLSTNWDLPFKAGAALHLEQTSYNLTSGSKVKYTSLSFGPLFKTKDLEYNDLKYRLVAQLRMSPFAKAITEGKNISEFRFNSTDLFTAFEHPIKNGFGEFVLGAFFQAQWLNIKQQTEIVSVRASNKANTSLGLSISQVFE
ncbi:MAG TPA: hypothetical protein VNJ08_03670 [Bacteriovoracaceae bacterium]|nr:hypothetical protein [Bacteriovoracaceae bacterium]